MHRPVPKSVGKPIFQKFTTHAFRLQYHNIIKNAWFEEKDYTHYRIAAIVYFDEFFSDHSMHQYYYNPLDLPCSADGED